MKVCVCACVFVCVRVSSFTTMCMDVHARMLVGHLCQCLKALSVFASARGCVRAHVYVPRTAEESFSKSCLGCSCVYHVIITTKAI